VKQFSGVSPSHHGGDGADCASGRGANRAESVLPMPASGQMTGTFCASKEGDVMTWTKLPDTTCPAGWIIKEESAFVGRLKLRVQTQGREASEWYGSCSGVCCTGKHTTAERAKAALVKLVRKALRKALAELDEK
jgi:hypothetical protein